jgi:hypothetical protein
MNDNLFNNILFVHRDIKKIIEKLEISTEFKFIKDELLFIYCFLGDELANIMPQRGMKMNKEFYEIKEKYYSKKRQESVDICNLHEKEILEVEKYTMK